MCDQVAGGRSNISVNFATGTGMHASKCTKTICGSSCGALHKNAVNIASTVASNCTCAFHQAERVNI